MGDVEYTYTRGMDDGAVANRLEGADTGVLALAEGDDAYAIPVAFHREDDRIYFRLAIHEGSEKAAYLDSTASPRSWSTTPSPGRLVEHRPPGADPRDGSGLR